jgi:translation initiation factor IF-2
MSIRLNKAIKEFNVGLQNIVDYLNANGGALKGDPNEKINDEQYALLQKQFGADKALHDEAAKIFSKPEKAKKEDAPAEVVEPAVVEDAPAEPVKKEKPVKKETKAEKAPKKEETPVVKEAPVVETVVAEKETPAVEEKQEAKPAKK